MKVLIIECMFNFDCLHMKIIYIQYSMKGI
nr:hypothetical protein YSBCXYJI_YSBCXYJI_CDS_0170 [Caudoviricetes sp.]